MIQATTNSVIVKVDHKYTSNLSSILKLASIQNNATVDPADLVNIMGEVISLPKRIDNKREYAGFTAENIQIGDTAIFSYSVILDLVEQPNGADPIFKNNFFYKGKDYFLCDITKLYAVIRDVQIIMQNGYVMGTPIEESKIILPAGMRNQKKASYSTVMHIGYPKTTEKQIEAIGGDVIYVNSNVVEKYQINKKHFIITQQSKVLGIKMDL